MTSRSFRALLVLLLAALAGACASTGSGGAAVQRITLRDFRGQQHFELVSESHTDRIEYYSEARGDAARKIQTDEAMRLVIDQLEKDGFGRYAQDGRGPSRGSSTLTRSLEIQTGDETRHWVVGSGSDQDELKRFLACTSSFFQIYNITQSFQVMENDEGKAVFQDAAGPATGRP